jgi:hypothetical protein
MSTGLARVALEARIEREREELAEALQDLRVQARERIDPRNHVRARPGVWLGGALLFGFLWGVRR